ncbi:MAG TPA: hypothetical protein VKV16_03175 [Solirubrobacteraceae bacterium]|nr:hypothetical protein [Solirubrobacteraceae bacterium]
MNNVGGETLVAANESVHRRINEAIERGRWPGENDAMSFRCECARPGCTGMLELTHEEYEQLRDHPRRFAVLPGHQEPDVEAVVETRSGYLLVEKHGLAGQIARATDPRS